jgi:hypothetical protein
MERIEREMMREREWWAGRAVRREKKNRRARVGSPIAGGEMKNSPLILSSSSFRATPSSTC